MFKSMKPDSWNTVQSLFAQAVELTEPERDTFLEQIRAQDPDLYEELRSLLQADSEPHSLLEGLAVEAMAPEPLSLHGQQIGPYQLVEEIGSGGMGTVYLAERTAGNFEQTVALKLIKPGMDSQEILRRFRSERQIMARLQHPNIAALLDGSLTTDGRPYFTMEYIAGEPITAYCDNQQLTVEERLDLFQTVCAAVQYAHRNLIVHRDLKPGNILVTKDGTVKLLDFGIAKVLAPEGGDPTSPSAVRTRTGARVLTPEYAAPEQIRGEQITTAADLYALGVILYELLTGRRPFALARSPAEIEQAILTTDPQKPSTAVTQQTASVESESDLPTSEAISAARNTLPERLRKRLRGDLDNICLMALRKEPERRYGSVEQFLQDIKRHLAGLPVSARPATLGYRIDKFVHRHKAGVTTAVAVLLLIAALIGFYTARLAEERDRARLEARKAEQVADFLQGLFAVADPEQAKGESITARELLERGADRISTELADQPEVQATMMTVIGDVYRSLGLYAEATQQLEQAVRIREQLYGPDHPEVAEAYFQLAHVHHDDFDHQAADAALAKALAIQRQNFEPIAPEILRSLHLQAQTHSLHGNYARADSIYREILNTHATKSTLSEEAHTAILRDRAAVQRELGHFETAEKLYRKTLGLNRRIYGEVHPEVAIVLHALGDVLRHKGDLTGAEAFYRQALIMREKLFGDVHPDIGETLNHLARLLYNAGEYDRAEPLARRALAVRKHVYGDANVAVVASSGCLAGILKEKGEIAEAEKLYRQNVATLAELVGEAHPYYAASLNSLAGTLFARGDLKAAERLYRRSLALHRQLLPANHVNLSNPLHGLGKTLVAAGRARPAESLLREAEERLRKNLPTAHWRIAEVRTTLGRCLTLQNRLEEAETYLLQSHKVLKEHYRERSNSLRTAAQALVLLYERWDKPGAAERYRERE